MNTPSIRLPDNIHRAVKNSEYSIGDLARTGIEEAVISGFSSICWICGAGIHRKERSRQTNRNQIREHIAGDSEVNWRIANLPKNQKQHQNLQKHVQSQFSSRDQVDEYYQLAGDWLAIPDRPVDVCTDCLDLLDRIRNQKVPLGELPVPYLFRQPKNREEADIDPIGARKNPMVAYATDVTAVALADYISFRRREDEEVFWWAARERHQTVKYGINLWRETAVRSHAHRLGWGNQPLPVFELAVESTPVTEDVTQNQLAHQQPGLSKREKEETLEGIQEGEYCPGCGDGLPEYGSNYCSSCLFFGYRDSQFSDDCEEPFVPYIDGDFRSENVMRRCCECGEVEDVQDEYIERFMKRYQPVFESMEYAIPMGIPEDPR
ncbi:hypothetical protein [Natronomonas amylolytica]|uniref:hypothetical protein n=1 Tax=Natronomonas amylolytica TaxID=3108498 RepID=UPI003008BFF0